jgi:hypothetical protein
LQALRDWAQESQAQEEWGVNPPLVWSMSLAAQGQELE